MGSGPVSVWMVWVVGWLVEGVEASLYAGGRDPGVGVSYEGRSVSFEAAGLPVSVIVFSCFSIATMLYFFRFRN